MNAENQGGKRERSVVGGNSKFASFPDTCHVWFTSSSNIIINYDNNNINNYKIMIITVRIMTIKLKIVLKIITVIIVVK